MGKKIFKLFLAMFLCFTSITGNVVAETENQPSQSCKLYYANDGNDGIEIQCSEGIFDSFASLQVIFNRGENDYSFTVSSSEVLLQDAGMYPNGKKVVFNKDELSQRIGNIPEGGYNISMSLFKVEGQEPHHYGLPYDGDGDYIYPNRETGGNQGGQEPQEPTNSGCKFYYANGGNDGIEIQCSEGIFDSFATLQIKYSGNGNYKDIYLKYSNVNLVDTDNGKKIVIDKMSLANLLGSIPSGEYTLSMRMFVQDGQPGLDYDLPYAGDGVYTYPQKGSSGDQGGSGDGPQGPSFRLFYANGSNTPDGFEIQGPSSAFKNCVQIQIYFTDVNDSEKIYPYTVSKDTPKVHPQNEDITLITVSQQDINADENWPQEMTTGKYNVTLRLYTKENPEASGPATQTNYSLPFAQGTFEYVNYPGKNACVLRAVDVEKDADLIGTQNITAGFVVDCGSNSVFTSVDSYNIETITFELSNSESGLSFRLPNEKYLMNETKLLMPEENMPLIDTTIPAGTYAVNMKMTLRKGAFCPPSVSNCVFERAYVTYSVSDEFVFETNHKTMPEITVSADNDGVKFKCAGAACREWGNTLSVNENGNSSVVLMFTTNESNTYMEFANSADDRSSVVFTGAGDGRNYSIVIPKEKMIPYGIPEGTSLNNIQVAVYGYKTFVTNNLLELPFSSPSVDASKITVQEVIGSDGEPVLQIISSDTSEEYETWMENVRSLQIEGTSRSCGFDDALPIQKTDNQLMISIPQTGYGALQEVRPMKLMISAIGYISVVKEIELEYLYSDFTPNDFAVVAKASGLELHVTGKESGDWLKALTVFRENEDARPYVMLSAENMGNETIVKLMNQTATDKVLSLSNLTASDENHDENTEYTLLIPMDELVKHVDEFKAGNTPVRVRPAPYQYVANKMVDNVPVYPIVKLVAETQNAVDNNTNIETDVLDELDEYLTGNQITNVTVMVNNDDLRKNGSSKVELKGELTAMIVSDAEGNYTVNDLDHDSIQMNMSTTIDEVKLSQEEIEQYVDILMETANEMQTVYDNFGFDIKLHKEEKEMKDLAVATAITFELPEAITVNDGDTLVLLTVHNGTAKYLPVVIMTDADGNRMGIAYTSQFSTFIPVVLTAGTPIDVETKVEAGELTEVPTELVSKYETVEKLEEKMIAVLGEKSSITKENTAVYDVVLMVTFDGVNYVEADETHWPADGKIHVILPYPDGTDATYEFTVAHMFTKSLFGKTAGDIEYPTVTLTEKGVEFDVTGLSPISLGWKKEVAPAPVPTPDSIPETTVSTPEVPNTSDDSHLLGWALSSMLSLLLAIFATVQKKKQLMK